jgi:hypothetical protein
MRLFRVRKDLTPTTESSPTEVLLRDLTRQLSDLQSQVASLAARPGPSAPPPVPRQSHPQAPPPPPPSYTQPQHMPRVSLPPHMQERIPRTRLAPTIRESTSRTVIPPVQILPDSPTSSDNPFDHLGFGIPTRPTPGVPTATQMTGRQLEDMFLSVLANGSSSMILQLVMDHFIDTEFLYPSIASGRRSPFTQALLLTLSHRVCLISSDSKFGD